MWIFRNLKTGKNKVVKIEKARILFENKEYIFRKYVALYD